MFIGWRIQDGCQHRYGSVLWFAGADLPLNSGSRVDVEECALGVDPRDWSSDRTGKNQASVQK